MSTASVPYSDFTPGTAIASDEVEADLQALVDFLNTYVTHVDASRAFTGIPSGPATNPTTDNQFTRKAYVDLRATKAQTPNFKAGLATGSTDVAGNFSAAHGFPGGSPPTVATGTLRYSGPTFGSTQLSTLCNVVVVSIDATNVTFRIFNSATGTAMSDQSGWGVHWMAWRTGGVS